MSHKNYIQLVMSNGSQAVIVHIRMPPNSDKTAQVHNYNYTSIYAL